MDQNQRRSGLKHIKTIRNILDGTAIETEASSRIEKHLEGLKALFESDEDPKKLAVAGPAKGFTTIVPSEEQKRGGMQVTLKGGGKADGTPGEPGFVKIEFLDEKELASKTSSIEP